MFPWLSGIRWTGGQTSGSFISLQMIPWMDAKSWIITEPGSNWNFASQLAELERYTHLYYDLSINIAGIDAIHHMLERIELLQQEVRSLRNELEFYR